MATIVQHEYEAPPSRISMQARHAPVLAVAIALLGILALYFQTASSIVAIWVRSETFAHGFVIVPICLWLVWRRREELRSVPAEPWYPGLAAIALCGAIWLFGAAADVQSVQQFMLAFMLDLAVLVVVGLAAARAVAFPLLFLLFAVPFGEFMIPTMIDWTADFTIMALRATGVPVYREANHFALPSGNWSVIEACSGLRYLIASIVVGTIYSVLTYRSTKRRLAFIAASIVVPIIANWLRAYGIVLLGHLSNNRIAVGIDHVIYGWIFFGVVIAVLFWVGSLWREDAPADVATATPSIGVRYQPHVSSGNRGRYFMAAIAAVAVASVAPALLGKIAKTSDAAAPDLAALGRKGAWTPSERPIDWKPRYGGFARELHQGFRRDGDWAAVYIAYYRNQVKGNELITSSNVIVDKKDYQWRELERVTDTLELGDGKHEAQRYLISGAPGRIMAFRLYWIDGHFVSGDVTGKLMLAWSKLRGHADDSALVLFYGPANAGYTETKSNLQDFSTAIAPAVAETLADASRAARR
jgi:exosortase A